MLEAQLDQPSSSTVVPHQLNTEEGGCNLVTGNPEVSGLCVTEEFQSPNRLDKSEYSEEFEQSTEGRVDLAANRSIDVSRSQKK